MDFYLSRHESREQTRVPQPDRIYTDASVRDGLRRLFHDKCAFCETRTTLDIGRFRPRSEALPTEDAQTSHLYYSWLAGAWENFYAMCAECNLSQRARFPVIGNRAPLPSDEMIRDFVKRGDGLWKHFPLDETSAYLDPCNDNFFYRHLSVLPNGEMHAKSTRGKATIEGFRLDNPELTARRGAMIQAYARDLISILKYPREGLSEIFNFEKLEFGGSWYLVLRDVAQVAGRGKLSSTALNQGNIARFFATNHDLDFDGYFRPGPVAAGQQHVVTDLGRLRSVAIRNFKAIERLELRLRESEGELGQDNREPALLILGENAAGKSSILEAITLALCGDQERAALGLEGAALIYDPKLLGQPAAARRASASVLLEFDNGVTTELRINKAGLSVAGPVDLPVFAYGAFRQYLSQPKTPHRADAILSLFKSDAILADPEQWLLKLRRDRFVKVIRALRIILAIEEDFDVVKTEPEKGRCVIVNAPGPNASLTPLSIVSSGFRSVLGMVCEILQGLLEAGVDANNESFESIRAVVLIDEVEAHLHPRWKMQIMAGLREALPGVTFIATTHDPLCLRGVDHGEAVVIRRVRHNLADNDAACDQVELLQDLPDLTKLSIEQLLTSDFFGLASTDSAETEAEMASMEDILTRARNGGRLTESAQQALESLRRDISDVLPIGHGAAQQLIQEALLEFLQKRRQASAGELAKLKAESKRRIVAALESI